MENPLCIGLDVGTTKLVAAFVDKNKRLEVILTKQQERTRKFCLGFTKKERLFDDAADYEFFRNPENTIFGRDVMQLCIAQCRDFVSIFGLQSSSDGFKVNFQEEPLKISIENSIAMMVQHFKDETESLLHRKIGACVVTVPSCFNTFQRFAIKNAILSTGIDVQAILNSTTASAITYVYETQPKSTKNIVIIDMGATFLDVGVFKVTKNSVKTLASECSPNIGGDSFVWRLFDYFVHKIQKETGVHADIKLKARLFVACEKLKKKLSAASVDAFEELGMIDQHQKYTLEMTKVEFEDISSDLFNTVAMVVENAIRYSRVKDHANIILIGNGGLIPKIQVRLSELFNGATIEHVLNKELSIASGAAYFTDNKVKVTDILTTALTINNMNREVGEDLPLKSLKLKFDNPTTGLKIKQGDFLFTRSIYKKHLYIDVDPNGLVKVEGSNNEMRETLLNHQDRDSEKIENIQKQEKIFSCNNFTKEATLKNQLEEGYYRVYNIACRENRDQLLRNFDELLTFCDDALPIIENKCPVDLKSLKDDSELMMTIGSVMKDWKKLMTKVAKRNAVMIKPKMEFELDPKLTQTEDPGTSFPKNEIKVGGSIDTGLSDKSFVTQWPPNTIPTHKNPEVITSQTGYRPYEYQKTTNEQHFHQFRPDVTEPKRDITISNSPKTDFSQQSYANLYGNKH